MDTSSKSGCNQGGFAVAARNAHSGSSPTGFLMLSGRRRRTVRLGECQLAIGFAVGGEPGFRRSHKRAMPVSGDTLLRMIRAAELEPRKPRVWSASTTAPVAKG
jgi:hypothetical protein